MKPEQRQVEREDLKRLQSKAEYKRNPRFVPPLKGGLIKPSKEKKKKKLETDKESVFLEVFGGLQQEIVWNMIHRK